MLRFLLSVAAGGIIGGLAVAVLIVIAIVGILVVIIRRCRNDSENTSDLPVDYRGPTLPPIETLPPRLEVNLAYEQVKRSDIRMTDNSAYSV